MEQHEYLSNYFRSFQFFKRWERTVDDILAGNAHDTDPQSAPFTIPGKAVTATFQNDEHSCQAIFHIRKDGLKAQAQTNLLKHIAVHIRNVTHERMTNYFKSLKEQKVIDNQFDKAVQKTEFRVRFRDIDVHTTWVPDTNTFIAIFEMQRPMVQQCQLCGKSIMH